MKNPGSFKVAGDFLKEVSLHDVRLDPNSIQGRAQQTNLEYLLMLDEDNLVWSFRKTAGLPTPGKPYGGWEGPDVELRGHFVETGGMNDVLYRLFTVTGDPKHLLLAHLFDKPCFLGLLAVQADDISGFHANTHIPVVIGAQMRYEVTGDPLYKVSRHLFRWTKEVAYADYYERALTNGVLGIQRGTEPGVMIYMLPQGRGVSKAVSYHQWGTPFDSFWCCYGTGNFLPVKWSAGDKLALQLPISLRTEAIKDDRAEYASVQAILYGHYLLCGYSNGDWDIKTGLTGSVSDWIAPVPSGYNNHLVTFSQDFGDSTFVIANSNRSITMEKSPKAGTDAALHATFRLIFDDTTEKISTIRDAIGKTVMLEPFDFPGMVLVHQGTENNLAVANSPDDEDSSSFRLVAGLDGKADSVSLESESQKGCYVYSGVKYSSGASMKLGCKSASSGDGFNQAVSFAMDKGE
ncbi:hypothetical protein COLO4_24842 [Corchorus olitorius]|uniref:Non-reducing end beta-L-arabinofuranosidase-like GH127 catalytic domain-containing protein n=1 Tax=Corchorus olitorius TaxID=93759 RepID=A0A1R3I6D1_9ROSI|nr:hypothetical protein COLO4_24842 [Corchorus olitorius]